MVFWNYEKDILRRMFMVKIMYWNPMAVLEIDWSYKKIKNYHPQVYAERSKYRDAESQQCSI